MSFKSMKQYNEERFGGFFLLRDDGDYKDVVFLYQDVSDVLIADVHYIKSYDYSGYVHCIGRGCPACGKDIKVQTKLFIPLYDIENDEILFWDRSGRFEQQLNQDVISLFPNPSEVVFRITRRGAAGSVDTTYTITPIGENKTISYSKLLASKNVSFPDYYSRICKDYDSRRLGELLNSGAKSVHISASDLGEYGAVPRQSVVSLGSNDKIPNITSGNDCEPIKIPDDSEIDDDNDSDDDVVF